MKDLIASFIETSKERLKNPFVGAFILSFIAINWRPFWIVLFSDVNVEDRIIYVQDFYMTAEYGLVYPLVVALFYVIALPYITWGLELLVNKSVVERKKMSIGRQVQDIIGKQQLAIEEAKLEDAKASFRDKADLNKRIEQLQKQLDKRDELINSLNNELSSLREDYEVMSLSVPSNSEENTSYVIQKYQNEYEAFKKSDMYDFFRETGVSIRNENKFPHGLNEIIREKFLVHDIVKEMRDEENQRTYYTFTDKGTFFWREYVLGIRVERTKKPNVPLDSDDLPF